MSSGDHLGLSALDELSRSASGPVCVYCERHWRASKWDAQLDAEKRFLAESAPPSAGLPENSASLGFSGLKRSVALRGWDKDEKNHAQQIMEFTSRAAWEEYNERWPPRQTERAVLDVLLHPEESVEVYRFGASFPASEDGVNYRPQYDPWHPSREGDFCPQTGTLLPRAGGDGGQRASGTAVEQDKEQAGSEAAPGVAQAVSEPTETVFLVPLLVVIVGLVGGALAWLAFPHHVEPLLSFFDSATLQADHPCQLAGRCAFSSVGDGLSWWRDGRNPLAAYFAEFVRLGWTLAGPGRESSIVAAAFEPPQRHEDWRQPQE